MSNETETVAAQVLEGTGGGSLPPPKRRGRPPGSKNRPREDLQPEPIHSDFMDRLKNFQYVKDENSVIASAILGGTVWSIIGKFFKLRGLTDPEAMKLGEALDPILQKYVPIFAEWKYEINLVVIIVQLVEKTRIKEVKPEAESEPQPA